MKKCKYCHVEKSLEEFPLKKDGTYSGNCISCKEKRKKYREDNKEKISKEKKEYYQDNKEKILQERKDYYSNNTEEILKRNLQNYEDNKEQYLIYKKEYYQENKEHLLDLEKANRLKNPGKFLWKAAKKRAKEKELPFNIDVEDIIIPEKCPIFEFPLVIGNSIQERDNSPSLDRIIPELGYVKGNVKVISFKANTLKRDGHIEDFEKIINYIRKYSNANR